MKKLLSSLLVSLSLSCQTGEQKIKEFNFEAHLKSNEWCTFLNENQRCFSFADNKMIISQNGLDESIINVAYNQKSDSVVAVKFIGKKGSENYFRMKSMDTLYFYQSEENDFKVEFIRIPL